MVLRRRSPSGSMTRTCRLCGKQFESLTPQRRVCRASSCRAPSGPVRELGPIRRLTTQALAAIATEADKIRALRDERGPVSDRQLAEALYAEEED